MGMAAKVLWGEGLFLRPQHFQRQDQYHEMPLHHTTSALHPYSWGVAHMQWDLAALKTGTLRLQVLSAIFHDGEAFDAAIDGIIRELLNTVISSRYFSIAVLEDKPSYYLGKLDSDKIDQHATLHPAIRAAMPAIELVDMVPLRVKVGAPDDVEKCVLSAMPGVKLSHGPQMPAAIPVRPDTYHFAIDNRNLLYEQMLKAQSISVSVPSGISDLQLELIAVAA